MGRTSLVAGGGCVAVALLCSLYVARRTADATSDPRLEHPDAVSVGEDELLQVRSEPPKTVEAARKEAIDTATRLVERFADSPEAWGVLARLYAKLARAAKTEECWKKCLAVAPRFIDAYIGLAVAAGAKADNAEAIRVLRKALEIAPDSAEVRRRLAESLLKEAEFEEATALLQANTSDNPGSYEDWCLLGQACTQTKDFQQAKESLEKAVALGPVQPDTHYMLARVCAQLGLRDEAAKYQAKFAELQNNRQEFRRETYLSRTDLGEMCETASLTYMRAAEVYAHQGEIREAEAHWLRGAAIDPTAVELRRRLASFYTHAGRFTDAVRIHQELVNIEPENMFNHVNLGTLLARLEQFDAAEKAFEDAVSQTPENALGYTCLAQLYMQTGRMLPRAIEHARTAVRLEPSAMNYAILAVACEQNGDPAGAREAARQATDREPGSPKYLDLYRRYDQPQ